MLKIFLKNSNDFIDINDVNINNVKVSDKKISKFVVFINQTRIQSF